MAFKRKMVSKVAPVRKAIAPTLQGINRVITPTSEIMMRPWFINGVNDALTHRPFRKDYEKADIQGQWTYERGRLFATLYKKVPYANRTVTSDAVRHANMYFENGDMI